VCLQKKIATTEIAEFLVLKYTPPPPIDVILSPSHIEKYSRLFAFLIYLTKMNVLTNQIASKARNLNRLRSVPKQSIHNISRFQIEVQHLVHSLLGYTFDYAINGNWAKFMASLNNVRKIDPLKSRPGTPITGPIAQSMDLPTFREYHHYALDTMLTQCLLKRKQYRLMKFIQDIFQIIAGLYTKVSLIVGVGDSNQDLVEQLLGSINDMHIQFRRSAFALMKCIKGLDEQGTAWTVSSRLGPAVSTTNAEPSIRSTTATEVDTKVWFEQLMNGQDGRSQSSFLSELLLRLDYNGWYTAAADQAPVSEIEEGLTKNFRA